MAPAEPAPGTPHLQERRAFMALITGGLLAAARRRGAAGGENAPDRFPGSLFAFSGAPKC